MLSKAPSPISLSVYHAIQTLFDDTDFFPSILLITFYPFKIPDFPGPWRAICRTFLQLCETEAFLGQLAKSAFFDIIEKDTDQKGVVILFSLIKPKACALALAGSAILAFGLYNVHALSGVTEGGVLGMTLLLHHWFGISPAVSGLITNGLCYLMGYRLLGRTFIAYSIVAGGGFSLFYALCEQFDPLWPQLAAMPLLAAVLGALFVGIGVGLSVRAGGAPGGDDALAMSISAVTHWKIQWAYLISDLTVLALSATYISLDRLACSLLTVTLSGQIIGVVQRIGRKKEAADTNLQDMNGEIMP